MWLDALRKSEDHEAQCPTCGGGVQRRAFGEMYAGSFISDGQRVEIRRIPHEGFSNPVVLDPLTQYFDGGLYRLWPSDKYLSRGGKKLHRDVWTVAFGEIPRGCHIHHKDGNTKNNALDNLECIPASIHLSGATRKRNASRIQHFTESAREKAADWHRSEEGRLWHRRHMARVKTWTKWKRVPKICPYCQVEFQGVQRTSGFSQIYCSEKCKMSAYRIRKQNG